MKIWIFSFFTLIACITAATNAENLYSEEVWDALNYRKKLDKGTWLPFKMVFPEHYVVLTADRSHELGLSHGFICGERASIKDFWIKTEKDPNCGVYPLSAFFYFSWSWDVAQTGEKEFSCTDEEVHTVCKKSGAKSIKINNVFWKDYPVKAVEIVISPGCHKFVAWIGLNTGGEVMKVEYFCPQPSTNFTQESAIWEEFIHKSTGFSSEEYFENIDKEMKELQKLVEEKKKALEAKDKISEPL